MPARPTEAERRARTEIACRRGVQRVTGVGTNGANDDIGRGPATMLATISRGDRTELRIEWAEYKGHRYVGIREWYRTGPDSKWLPGKRGISIKRRELNAVTEALKKALVLAEDDTHGEQP